MRFLALLLLVGGCRVVYPGDGQLVAVELDEALRPCATEALRIGTHYWDEAGVQLRVREELPAGGRIAAKISVRGDACTDLGDAVVHSGNGTVAPTPAAQYDLYGGNVYLFLKNWTDDMPGMAQTIAHELGHAIGLDHVHEYDAVMNGDGGPYRPDLADADLREHARVWP